ncbi:MAG: BON domain-containing protein [Firmicutes bacterium]|nr:BON domain-containing protein [Bacillota bacterium]
MTTTSRKWPGLILILIILFALFSGVAESQDFTLPPHGELLVLPRGESLLLPVFEPKRVAVADPLIADVVIVNTEQILVNGINVGTTTLQIWENNGVAYYRVRVVPNPDALVAELRKQLNLPGIKIHILNEKVILDGIIESNADRERALKLAGAYGEVIDLLQVTGALAESDLAQELAEVIQRPDIQIREINDYLVLEGETSSLEERHRAELLASTFNRPVLNFLKIPSDEQPMELLAGEIAQHIAIPTIQVRVIADQTFLLEGEVPELALKERAAAIAHAFGQPVVNLIQVQEKPSPVAAGTTDVVAKSDSPITEPGAVAKAKPGDDSGMTEAVAPEPVEALPADTEIAEPDIHAWVQEMKKEIDDPDVSLRVIQDTVLLEGMVKSEYARERLIAIAQLYPVRIVDLLQMEDQPIDHLTQEREWLVRYINDPNIQVTLVHNTVLLEGEIASELSRRRAVAVARALGLEVVDLLELKADILEADHVDGFTELDDAEVTTPDLCQIVPDMKAALGEENLQIFELNGLIVIEGQVPNEFRKLRAERIAATFQVPLLTLIQIEHSPVEEANEQVKPTEPADMALVEPSGEPKATPKQSTVAMEASDIASEGTEPEGMAVPLEGSAEQHETDAAREIENAVGLSGVVVHMIQGAAVLDGFVQNELEAQGAEAIAGLFADMVVNRLQILPPAEIPGPGLCEMISEVLALPTVQVNLAGEKLLLEGVVSDQKELERAVKIAGAFGKEVINLIRVEAPLQVLLKVKVVEASRVDLDRVGISWGSLERGVLIPDVVYIGELMIDEPLERLYPIGARLEALIDEGKARLLAAPSLLTLSGKAAEFLSGGEIPVTVPKDGDLQILWKEYGVKLNILPVVVDEDAVEVIVRPEVSTLDWANGIRIDSLTLPAMKTRRTETVVYIQDGTTFVISGLLANTDSQQVHKVPLLGDLPIIGKLFRSEQFKTDQSELIFFVTPHILRGNEPAMDQELWRDEDIQRREGLTCAPAVASFDC